MLPACLVDANRTTARFILKLSSVIILGLVTAPVARAQATIVVDSNLQVANPGVNGNNDGLCQLSEAIRAANTNLAVDSCVAGQSSGTDTIELQAAGPYYFNQVDNTAVGSSALPVVTSPILINGFNKLLFRDGSSLSSRFFIVQGGSLTITDTAINDISVVVVGIADGDGGFVYVENGSLTLTRCSLTNGRAGTGRFGGFVALVNSTLNITDSVFDFGKADAGGGMINGSASTINITNSELDDGSATGAGASGGVIRCFTTCNTTIVDSNFSSDSADTSGGAIATDSPLSLTRVRIANSFAGFAGTSGAVRGGAIDSSDILTIQDSLFWFNNANGPSGASADGGGIYSTGTLTISGTSFVTNQAIPPVLGTGSRGGAIFLDGSATITNSTISTGFANFLNAEGGAGIFVRNTATLLLNNVTLTGNSTGGGIVREAGGAGTVTLRNSILAGNTGFLNSAPSDCTGTFVSQGHNIFGVNTSCTFTPASGDQVGTSATPVDPVLGILDQSAGKITGCNAGGCSSQPIPTHPLLVTSPAIDAGDPAVPGTGGTSCALSDQNGVARPVGAACDIGAWEGAAVVPTVDIALTKTGAPDPVSVGGTLTYSLNIGTFLAFDNVPAVVLTDTLPAGVTFVSATAFVPTNGAALSNCTEAAGTVTCTFSSLPRGFILAGGVQISVQPTSSAVSPIINNASVTSAGTDPNNANNSATASTVVTAGGNAADLSVIKTDSPDPVNVGSNLTYTVTVANAGPSAATSVVLTDALPANVTFVSATPPCTEAAGTVTCNLGTINSGANTVITIVVTPTAAAAASISNTASVTAVETDNNPADNSQTITTTVNPVADVSVTKTGAPNPVNVGSNLTYTVTVANAGPSSATSVVLTDTLPANVTFVSATAPCTQAAGTVTCNLGTINSGANTVITIVVTPTAAAAASIANTASVTSAVTDPSAANNSQTINTTVSPVADLSVTKTGAPNPVNVGSNLTYTVTVANAGPSSATSVVLTDTLPANVTFVSATAPCTQAAGTVTCNLGTINSGANTVITIVVTPTAAAAASIANTASVTSAVTDPSAANNSQSINTTVNPVADLSVTKTDAPDPVPAGSNLTYTITVNNAGPSAAAGVSLNDTLPAGTTFVSLVSAAGWLCTTPAVGAAGTVTCTIASLASGAPAVFTLVVKTSAAGTLNNTATVATTTTDPSAANNSATTGTTVSAAVAADFTISAAPAQQNLNQGQTVTFVITLTPTPAGTSFNNPIQMSVVGELPVGLVVFIPTSVTPGANPANVNMTVTFPPRGSTAPPAPRGPQLPLGWLLLGAMTIAMAVLALLARRQLVPRKLVAALALLLLVVGGVLMQSACVTGGRDILSGPKTLTVTGTSGALSHSVPVILNLP